MAIFRRAGVYHFKRRVPARFAAVEARAHVTASLHTDSEALARDKAVSLWRAMVDGWEARLAGRDADAQARFQAARDLAAVRGHRYFDVSEVARLPLPDLLARIDAVDAPGGVPNADDTAALMGTVAKPSLTVMQALEDYWTLTADRVLAKSADQVRRWRNPRVRAVTNFVRVAGDKPLDAITRDDLLDFRQSWLDRLVVGEVSAGTANKDLVHLGDVLKTVNQFRRLGLDLPLGELSFREGEKRPRPPFSADWIRARILAPGALDGLNPDARGLVLGMVNTGYRPSEGAALTSETIRLDGPVPYISIEPGTRQLKTQHARRTIPLLGVSLAAFRAAPGGFPRYLLSADPAAAINKFMRENGLMETEGHTLYCFRHSFEDRMLAASVDERVRRDLMGHALDRERYGAGASLEHKSALLGPVAL